MQPNDWPTNLSSGKKNDTGKIPQHVTIPKFLANPSHRKKVVGTQLYSLTRQPKKTSEVTNEDAKKLKSMWGYMLSGLRELDPVNDKKEIQKRGKAVLEHYFNNHRLCDISWCKWLQSRENNTRYKAPHKYRQTTHKALYEQLQDTLE